MSIADLNCLVCVQRSRRIQTIDESKPIKMNHKKFHIFFAALLMLIGGSGLAQVKIGAKVGYSLGRLTDSSDNIYTQDFENTDGIDFGALVEYSLSERFSLQGEILLTQRGGKRDGLQPIPAAPLIGALEENGITLEQLNQLVFLQGRGPVTDADPLYADFENISELQYLEIPILAKLGWGDEWRFYVEAGPYVGFLLSANQKTSGDSQFYLDGTGDTPLGVPNPFYDPNDPSFGPPFIPIPAQEFDANTDAKSDLNDINFGIHAGTGIIRRIAEQHHVFFGFRASYGFIPLQKDKVFGESRIGGLTFSLGYTYSL